MKIMFMGGKDIGNYCFKYLISNNIVPLLFITMENMLDSELRLLIKERKVELVELNNYRKNINTIKQKIDEFEIEILISVAFPYILHKAILESIKYPINVHPAALPKYRGFHPLSEAFMRDDPYQGTTVHFMSDIVDEGDIILQDFVKIENTDDMTTVKLKLIELSGELLMKSLNQILNNCVHRRPQIGEVIVAPKRLPQDSEINFNNSSRYIHNFIRALVDPYPNAFVRKTGNTINFKRSIVSNIYGEVLDKTVNGRYVISTKDGVVLVETDYPLRIGEVLSGDNCDC